MKNTLSTFLATLFGYLATVAAVVLIPLILIASESRSEWFWWRVAWTEVLALLCWGFIGFALGALMPARSRSEARSGVLPILGTVVFLYAALSFSLVLLGSFLPELSWFKRTHMALQVVFGASFLVSCAGIRFVKIGARSDYEGHARGQAAASRIVQLLRDTEGRVDASGAIGSDAGASELRRRLRLLREKLEYSAMSKVAASELAKVEEETRAMITDVGRLCDSGGTDAGWQEASQKCQKVEAIVGQSRGAAVRSGNV